MTFTFNNQEVETLKALYKVMASGFVSPLRLFTLNHTEMNLEKCNVSNCIEIKMENECNVLSSFVLLYPMRVWGGASTP